MLAVFQSEVTPQPEISSQQAPHIKYHGEQTQNS
jgi:hypothetical protein